MAFTGDNRGMRISFTDSSISIPLATRMRPKSIEEFVGQEEIVGEGKVLRKAIEEDKLTSVIFYGPPGTGKTTLAKIIAENTRSNFEELNAVTAGIADIREVIKVAREKRMRLGQKTTLFIDEIHRFNKSQQDALLPAVEDGIVILIGATTENPYFEVNAPLVSRSRVYRLHPLTDDEIRIILYRALEDKENGFGALRVEVDKDALEHIVSVSNGDARIALNALETAVFSTSIDDEGTRRVSLTVAEDSIQQRAIRYDKSGDAHYDTVSAFIKSMRGSDPDAALYWLARMIYAGEDPRFIARRLIIHAAEDVGCADPHALLVAVAAAQALEFVGMPEARIPLAEATVYIACAPKSNAVCAGINGAMKDVETKRAGEVPLHLRDSSYRGAKTLGHGTGYKYPHDYPNNFVSQQYLPNNLKGRTYYNPTKNGYEGTIRARIEYWNKLKKS